MKKNFSVNINNKLFNIDEDAYDRLNQYFKYLETSFSDEAQKDEIIQNFHIRISQMLTEYTMKDESHIVTIEIVEKVLFQLGFTDNDNTKYNFESDKKTKHNKRLYRNPDDRIVGGVCGGLAKYLNIDVIIVRISFVIFTLFFAVGLFAYLIMWMFVPVAKTPVDKLFMEGEEISVDKIKDSLSKEFKNFENNIKDWKKKLLVNYNSDDFGDNLSDVLFLVLRIFVGVFLVFISLFLIVGLILLVFQPFGNVIVANYNIPGWDLISLLLYKGNYVSIILKWSVFVIFMFPFASILLSGISVLIGSRIKSFGLKWVFNYIGILSLVAIVVIGILTYLSFIFLDEQEVNYEHEATYSSEIHIELDKNINLNKLDADSMLMYLDFNLYKSDNESFLIGKPLLTIEQSEDNKIKFLVRKRSYGRTPRAATQNLESIEYRVCQSRDTIFISDYWKVSPALWRAQNLNYVVQLPVNKRISISSEIWRNFKDMEYQKIQDVKFVMTKEGLKKR